MSGSNKTSRSDYDNFKSAYESRDVFKYRFDSEEKIIEFFLYAEMDSTDKEIKMRFKRNQTMKKDLLNLHTQFLDKNYNEVIRLLSMILSLNFIAYMQTGFLKDVSRLEHERLFYLFYKDNQFIILYGRKIIKYESLIIDQTDLPAFPPRNIQWKKSIRFTKRVIDNLKLETRIMKAMSDLNRDNAESLVHFIFFDDDTKEKIFPIGENENILRRIYGNRINDVISSLYNKQVIDDARKFIYPNSFRYPSKKFQEDYEDFEAPKHSFHDYYMKKVHSMIHLLAHRIGLKASLNKFNYIRFIRDEKVMFYQIVKTILESEYMNNMMVYQRVMGIILYDIDNNEYHIYLRKYGLYDELIRQENLERQFIGGVFYSDDDNMNNIYLNIYDVIELPDTYYELDLSSFQTNDLITHKLFDSIETNVTLNYERTRTDIDVFSPEDKPMNLDITMFDRDNTGYQVFRAIRRLVLLYKSILFPNELSIRFKITTDNPDDYITFRSNDLNNIFSISSDVIIKLLMRHKMTRQLLQFKKAKDAIETLAKEQPFHFFMKMHNPHIYVDTMSLDIDRDIKFTVLAYDRMDDAPFFKWFRSYFSNFIASVPQYAEEHQIILYPYKSNDDLDRIPAILWPYIIVLKTTSLSKIMEGYDFGLDSPRNFINHIRDYTFARMRTQKFFTVYRVQNDDDHLDKSRIDDIETLWLALVEKTYQRRSGEQEQMDIPLRFISFINPVKTPFRIENNPIPNRKMAKIVAFLNNLYKETPINTLFSKVIIVPNNWGEEYSSKKSRVEYQSKEREKVSNVLEKAYKQSRQEEIRQYNVDIGTLEEEFQYDDAKYNAVKDIKDASEQSEIRRYFEDSAEDVDQASFYSSSSSSSSIIEKDIVDPNKSNSSSDTIILESSVIELDLSSEEAIIQPSETSSSSSSITDKPFIPTSRNKQTKMDMQKIPEEYYDLYDEMGNIKQEYNEGIYKLMNDKHIFFSYHLAKAQKFLDETRFSGIRITRNTEKGRQDSIDIPKDSLIKLINHLDTPSHKDRWLDDQVISGYLKRLTFYCRHHHRKQPVFCVDPIWENYKDIERIERIIFGKVFDRNFDAQKQYRILIPYNQNGNHWILVEMIFIVQKQHWIVNVYDSLEKQKPTDKNYLNYKNIRRTVYSLEAIIQISEKGIHTKPRLYKTIQKQSNRSDCGVFTIMFSKHILDETFLAFSAGNLEASNRARIAILLELINNVLYSKLNEYKTNIISTKGEESLSYISLSQL